MPHESMAATIAPIPPHESKGTYLVCRLALEVNQPAIVFHHMDKAGGILETFAVPSRAEQVHIALPSGSITRIDAMDVLEHAQDEQAFLAECARLLIPGGELRIRVPVDGLTGWLDALTMVRYLAELTGLTREPDEPQPMGWHRHYRPRDITRVVTEAGFSITETKRVNLGLLELPHAAGLVVGQAVLKRPNTERTLFRLRQRLADAENAIPAGPLGSRIEITARRPGGR